MPWDKDRARSEGELEFHFANEVRRPDDEHVRRALARHERRHPQE